MEVARVFVTNVVDELREETVQLLQTLKDVDPAIRRLALDSAPFGVRSELIAHELGEDDVSTGGFRLTPVGEAIVASLAPLSTAEQRAVAKEAEQALAVRAG